MSIRFPVSRRSPVPFFLAAVATLLLAPLSAPARGLSTVPLAPLPEQPVWSDAYKTRQADVYEALGHIRTLQARAMADPVKTAAMEEYDVTFYDLDLELDPVFKILTGSVSTTAVVLADSLAMVELHLDQNMVVTEVRSAGSPVTFTHANDLLDIDLERTYLQGEAFTVTVDYSGDPEGDYFGWDTYDNQPLVWSLSEPYGAREWWPCKDLNTDKADSAYIDVTVPDPLIVAGNGLLQDTSVPEEGKTTYHWRELYPICTYLVSVTAHPFAEIDDVYIGLQDESMPLTHFVVQDKVGAATSGYAATPTMIHTFALAYGEYPFINEKYGHAHFPWGGGMEHQTCSSMAYNYYYETFVAHELSHQWFGDMITCADFHHIWLNEGFATWSEAYWLEQSQGEAAYHSKMNERKYFGSGSVYVPDASDFNVIFNYWTTYAKAAWVVHMLRHVMGDADFFAALAAYRQAYAFSSANTEQFQAVCESVSGLALGSFFNQWIYGQYYPQYEVAWSSSPTGSDWRVDLRIAQIQTDTGLFEMPLDVRITTATGSEDFVVQNSEQVQWYHFEVNDQPTGVVLDPDDWVLCEKTDGGISDVLEHAPDSPHLLGAVPNPFNPMTAIRFNLPQAAEVGLAVYDVSGRLVRNLAPGFLTEGDHSVNWNGTDDSGRAVASGTYFARMTAGPVTQVRPLMLVR